MFFSKRKVQKNIQYPFLQRVAGKVIQIQEKWASYLQEKTARLAPNTLRYLVALFFISFTCISGYIIISSVKRKAPALSITPIRLPHTISNPQRETSRSSIIVTDNDYERLKRFREYMDSLHKTPPAKHVYDSILLNRSGLLDSIQQLEHLYHLQQSKK